MHAFDPIFSGLSQRVQVIITRFRKNYFGFIIFTHFTKKNFGLKFSKHVTDGSELTRNIL